MYTIEETRSYVQTRDLIGSLLDHYVPEETPPGKYMAGAYISQLEGIQEEVGALWQEVFGIELPPYFAQRNYTLADEEHKHQRNILEFLDKNKRDIRSRHSIFSERGLGMIGTAAYMRKDIYASRLAFETAQPNLKIEQSEESLRRVVPPIMRDRFGEPYRRRPSEIDCAVAAYGMTTGSLAKDKYAPGSYFEFGSLKSFIERHPLSPATGAHDLPWMLGSLSTKFAETELGAQVRVITSVGADLGEIDKKILRPVHEKNPSIQATVSIVLTSEKLHEANHAVAVTAADGEEVTVMDPLEGFGSTRAMSAETFWNRWAPANMQAVVTLIKPTI